MDVSQWKHLFPRGSHLDSEAFETELDGVQVVQLEKGVYCLRLIGPGPSVNLILEPPTDGSTITTFRVTAGPVDELEVVLEFNEKLRRRCLADFCFSTYYLGLHRWLFYRSAQDNCLYGSRSWARAIFARIASLDGVFILRYALDVEADPTQVFHDALFPVRDIRESLSSCPGLSEETQAEQEKQFQMFATWRRGVMLRRELDEEEIEELETALDVGEVHFRDWDSDYNGIANGNVTFCERLQAQIRQLQIGSMPDGL